MRLGTFASSIPLVFTAFTTGCTGFSLNEQNPGADTYLGYGSIAVDDRTEKSFVLNNFSDEHGVPTKSLLRAVDPDSGAVTEVTDLTGKTDPRILFPKSGIMVMSEQNGTDQLLLLDNQTFKEKQRADVDVRYNGTRMSPTRQWIAVADNTSEHAPIHIIDSEILTRRVIPHNGDWLEAMWKNKTDELFAIVFYLADPKVPGSKNHARILSWSMADVAAGEWKPDDTGFWPDRKLDIDVPDVSGDIFFSFTWVGISPDDKYAVFPVRETDPNTPEDYELLVVNTATGELRTVKDAKGPVGFTPDSSTIVSYDDKGNQNGADGKTADNEIDQRLVLIDINTLEVDPQDVDISGGLSYFISRDGNFVVCASNYSDENLVLYDIDNKSQSKMGGPVAGLDEFVSRTGKNELWLIDRGPTSSNGMQSQQGSLLKLDMNKGELDEIPTGYDISHLNILPKHDWLVMSEASLSSQEAPRLHFFDPNGLKDVKAVDMPGE